MTVNDKDGSIIMEETDLTPKRAAVLVASESVADAELVGKLLQDEFNNVRLSTKAEFAVEDFEKHRPAVLVLAFDTLEAAESAPGDAFRRVMFTPQRADLDLIIADALAWERQLAERRD